MSSTLSDAFRGKRLNLQHKLLDFTSLKELPDLYTWTEPDEYHAGQSLASESVPVIDLDGPTAVNVNLIGHACKTWGVFQVINHGIPTALLHNAMCTSRSLFTLPTEQKLKVARSPDAFDGYGFARISSFFSKLMWYEGFTNVGSPLDHFRQLWPQDYNMHCNVVEEYKKEMKKLAERLMCLILRSLGTTREDIKWAGLNGDFKDHPSPLNLNYYPACPDRDRAMGLAAHTDSSLFTILYQNSVSGLQVLREGTGWVTVPPVWDALVVNVGDMLHILSNGLYPSVLHRAVATR
ncbi:hypothetical protein AB3S75_001173 [Citrus x aurantiifolia]